MWRAAGSGSAWGDTRRDGRVLGLCPSRIAGVGVRSVLMCRSPVTANGRRWHWRLITTEPLRMEAAVSPVGVPTDLERAAPGVPGPPLRGHCPHTPGALGASCIRTTLPMILEVRLSRACPHRVAAHTRRLSAERVDPARAPRTATSRAPEWCVLSTAGRPRPGHERRARWRRNRIAAARPPCRHRGAVYHVATLERPRRTRPARRRGMSRGARRPATLPATGWTPCLTHRRLGQRHDVAGLTGVAMARQT